MLARFWIYMYQAFLITVQFIFSYFEAENADYNICHLVYVFD